MATKIIATDKELATLALAKALAEADVKGVDAALKAGADQDAFWIDGKTRLRDLAGARGAASVAKAMAKLFLPEATKKVPPFKSNREFWSEELVEFLVKRGFGFQGRTQPLMQTRGKSLALGSAKAAARFMNDKLQRLEDAVCKESDDGKSSVWQVTVGAEYRIPGFWVRFTIDAPAWELVEEFEAAMEAGTASRKPSDATPCIAAQKNWEGANIVRGWRANSLSTVEDYVACLRAGGNPFTSINDRMMGDPSPYAGNAQTKAFMDAIRAALGDAPGWHLRIKPLLKDAAASALQTKVELAKEVRKPRTPKKSLKKRTDIM